MTIPFAGIHHLTAIAGDPQRNVDFYMGVLGLRLVKRTVNFDDPGSYHLYYGDGLGRPGTVMTFFSWPGAPRGRQGVGQIGATAFAVSEGALEFWAERLRARGVEVGGPRPRFDDQVLAFVDPDGLPLELITSAADGRTGWTEGPVPAEQAIRGFHGATLWLRRREPSEALLTGLMGFSLVGQEGLRRRYATGEGKPGALVDLLEVPGAPSPLQANGTVHHIAWRSPDDAAQLAWHDQLARNGVGVTEVRERQYFRSIYYREPGGVLYEIATDPPGFTLDESPERLGTVLKLPPWLEPRRAQLERVLPPIQLPNVAREG